MSQIYYYVMEGSPLLLADERNKKHLLDLILDMHSRNGWGVYAFCVTDENLYLIANAEEAPLVREAQKVAAYFLKSCGEFPEIQAKRYLRVPPAEGVSRLELARRCRAIHRVPLLLGYVRQLGDYWWSSYNTYLCGYVWNAVDCSELLRVFSPNPERALRLLRQYHLDAGDWRVLHCRERTAGG